MTVIYEWDVETQSAIDTPELELGEVIEHGHTANFAHFADADGRLVAKVPARFVAEVARVTR